MNLRHGRMNLEQFHFGNYLQLPRWIFMTIWGILAKTTNRRKFYWGRRDNLSLQRGKIIDIIKKINSFPKKKKNCGLVYAVDPGTRWVWIVLVHLCTSFFNLKIKKKESCKIFQYFKSAYLFCLLTFFLENLF